MCVALAGIVVDVNQDLVDLREVSPTAYECYTPKDNNGMCLTYFYIHTDES